MVARTSIRMVLPRGTVNRDIAGTEVHRYRSAVRQRMLGEIEIDIAHAPTDLHGPLSGGRGKADVPRPCTYWEALTEPS